jgi:hypothetical protein
MDTVRNLLKPLIQLFPDSMQELMNSTIGVIALLLVILAVVAIVGAVILKVLKGALAGKNVPAQREKSQELDLDECPTPAKVPPDERLVVQGVPVRLRLVVVAPAGSESDLDLSKIGSLLDRAVPGLSKQYLHDRPTVKTWPMQVSHKGFAPTFFRKTGMSETKGQVSRWVLLAGRCVVGKKSFLLGLGLWADKPCTVGQLSVDADRWADICRLRA